MAGDDLLYETALFVEQDFKTVSEIGVAVFTSHQCFQAPIRSRFDALNECDIERLAGPAHPHRMSLRFSPQPGPSRSGVEILAGSVREIPRNGCAYLNAAA